MRGFYDSSERGRLQQFLDALKVVDESDLTVQDAQERLEYLDRVEAWLRAESQWRAAVKKWLKVEAERNARTVRYTEGIYAAAQSGWEAMKTHVPKLDGVEQFIDLSEAMQFRYAAFAAAVLADAPPDTVLSRKQVMGRTEIPEQDAAVMPPETRPDV